MTLTPKQIRQTLSECDVQPEDWPALLRLAELTVMIADAEKEREGLVAMLRAPDFNSRRYVSWTLIGLVTGLTRTGAQKRYQTVGSN